MNALNFLPFPATTWKPLTPSYASPHFLYDIRICTTAYEILLLFLPFIQNIRTYQFGSYDRHRNFEQILQYGQIFGNFNIQEWLQAKSTRDGRKEVKEDDHSSGKVSEFFKKYKKEPEFKKCELFTFRSKKVESGEAAFVSDAELNQVANPCHVDSITERANFWDDDVKVGGAPAGREE